MKPIYYKERVLSPLEDNSLNVKLSSAVLEDYNLHFKDKYPNLVNKKGKLNNNQILTKIILNYLNSQCLERKAFNIDVLVMLHNEKTSDYTIVGFRDDYNINKNKSQGKYSPVERIANEDFFESDNNITLKKAYNLLENDYLSEFTLPYDSKHYENDLFYYDGSKDIDVLKLYIKSCVEIGEDIKDNFIHFRVNNYLDNFIDGVFKGYSDSNVHKGLTMIQLEDKVIYFNYTWSYDLDNYAFNLLSLEVLSKEEFYSVVFNSTNEDLKAFVKSHEEVKAEYIPTSEEVKLNQLEERIHDLENNVHKVKIQNEKLSLENSNLKRQLKVYEDSEEDKINVEVTKKIQKQLYKSHLKAQEKMKK